LIKLGRRLNRPPLRAMKLIKNSTQVPKSDNGLARSCKSF